MYQIVRNTPFGFMIELQFEGCCYTCDNTYEIYINGSLYKTTNTLMTSIFGLTPDTNYDISLRGLPQDIHFQVKTKKANFVINVQDYHAKGDGVTDDTSAINAAIYTAPAGAVVVLPPGVYMVDHIFLKSHVDLYFEEGAVLKQNFDRKKLAVLKGYQKNIDYSDVTINASWEGSPLDCYCSLIYGKDVENIHIYGDGTIDGNGEQGLWWAEERIRSKPYRPRNMFFNACKDIAVSGLSSINSAAWNIHPFYSSNISFYGLTIKSNPTSENTDGLDPESCDNVEIVGCHFQVGDDCIAIKSGKFFMSRKHYAPCKHILIRNCFMEEGHGGVVIGSEIACGVYDVRVENCLFVGTDRGIRIKTRRGRGNRSVVKNIHCVGIQMQKVLHCFTINMFYFCDPDGHSEYVQNKEPLPVDEGTPIISEITIDGIVAKQILGSAIFIYGLPESKIKHVYVKNSDFSLLPNRKVECPAMLDGFVPIPNLGIFMQNATDIELENNRFEGSYVSIINGEEKTYE